MIHVQILEQCSLVYYTKGEKQSDYILVINNITKEYKLIKTYT